MQVNLFGKTYLANDNNTNFIAIFKKLVYEEGDYGYLLIDFTNILRGYKRASTLDSI